jgi:hypothetical protein
MDESTHRYREIRALLEHLVASWPWGRPGTPFENAKVYLDFHCADCGIKLRLNDLVVVLELEMLRIGTVDIRVIEVYDPLCVRCYIQRFAPLCGTAYRTPMIADQTSGVQEPTVAEPCLYYPVEFPSASPVSERHQGQHELSKSERLLAIGVIIMALVLVFALLSAQPGAHIITTVPPAIPTIPQPERPTPPTDIHTSAHNGQHSP